MIVVFIFIPCCVREIYISQRPFHLHTDSYDQIRPELVVIIPVYNERDSTSSTDEFFGFKLGKLHCRGQERTHQYLLHLGYVQPSLQVNNPKMHNGVHILTLDLNISWEMWL